MPSSTAIIAGMHRDGTRKRVCEKERRRYAVKLLRLNQPPCTEDVAELSGVSLEVATHLQQAISTDDEKTLSELLDPAHRHVECIASNDARTPISQKEKEQMKLRRTARITRRKHNGFQRNGFLLKDAFASSRKRSFTLFSSESSGAQVAKTFKKVTSLDGVLQFVKSEYPSIFEDPRRIWSCHETSVLPQFEKKNERCVSKHDQTKSTPEQHDTHVSVSITASAAGHVAPLLMTVPKDEEGMKYFFEPLEDGDLSLQSGDPHWLKERDWCPTETRFLVTQDGSVGRENLPLIINQLHEFIRVEVEQSQPVLLLLHGHSSPDRITWLEGCELLNMIVVSLPTNSTESPELYRTYINKFFQQAVQDTHDELKKHCVRNPDATVQVMHAVAGHRVISSDIVRKAFEKANIWSENISVVDNIQEQNRQTALLGETSNANEGDTLFYTEMINIYSHRVRDRIIYGRIRDITEQEECEIPMKLNLVSAILQLETSVDCIVDADELQKL